MTRKQRSIVLALALYLPSATLAMAYDNCCNSATQSPNGNETNGGINAKARDNYGREIVGGARDWVRPGYFQAPYSSIRDLFFSWHFSSGSGGLTASSGPTSDWHGMRDDSGRFGGYF